MKITKNYKNNSVTALGIGLTNKCNLNCPHCYSRNLAKTNMTIEDARVILNSFPNLKKVNFGTGENILNPSFHQIISLFENAGMALALTTNGLTISLLKDEDIKKFKDVDVSLDFPTEKLHDQWRGAPDTFNRAIDSLERCANLGVDTSIALALMNNNYQYLLQFRKIIDKFDICLRINIFKPVKNDRFELSYDQFWEAMKILSINFKLVSLSEPILSIITNSCAKGSPCGDSLRIHPDLTITECVYLNPEVKNFTKDKAKLPSFCQESKCRYIQSCQGGCFGRRILQNRRNLPDKYCPLYRNRPVPKIKFERAAKNDFIHSKYLCTFIVS